MNLTSRCRYSSGSQSPASTWPPSCTYARNSASARPCAPPYRPIVSLSCRCPPRREELTRAAARLFAEQGYQGTSLADLADALGVQKASLYHHIDAKEDLLWDVAREGADAFHAALDAVPETRRRPSGSGSRCARTSASSAAQLDIVDGLRARVALPTGERLERFVAERRRYEERIRELFPDGVERSELRTDLDVGRAALLFLSAANWAYTWLRAGADTDALADRFVAVLLDGMRGYATPALRWHARRA